MDISNIFKRKHINKDAAAIVYHSQELCFSELDFRINQLASFLFNKGLKPQDRAAIAMPNCPEFIISYLAITRAGGIAVPLNLLQTPQELFFIIQDCQVKFLLTNNTIAEQLSKASNFPAAILVLDDKLEKEISAVQPVKFPLPDAEQVCTFLYTSGTTGRPKAAMLTHANLLANVKSLDNASDLGPDDNFLAVLPMFHSFGWTVCVLLPLYLGARITILDNFRPKEILDYLTQKGITVFCGVPSMFSVLIKLRQKATFPDLKLAVSGGDSISAEQMKAFEQAFGFPIVEGYGLSEASPVVCLNPLDGVCKIKSIGIALPGVQVKVVDEGENELPPLKVGELIAKGANIAVGYYNREEETRETFRNGWLHTGDLAYKDQDGYYFIVGRKKDLIITSGFNVYPREIEELLAKHPSVEEAAVIGIPHPLKGEVAKAFIVPVEGKEISKQDLFYFLKDKLAGYKIPEVYEFVDDLPRGVGGKVLKRLLK